MQLLYLYVYWYNHIRNQHFIFNNNYYIEFSNSKNEITIEKKKNVTFPYFNENFLNINAIIGKNGSGKSTLISLIETFFGNYHLHNNRHLAVIQGINGSTIVLDNLLQEKNIKVLSNSQIKINYVKEDNEFISRSVSLIKVSNSFSVYEGGLSSGRFMDQSFDNIIDFSSFESNQYIIDTYDQLLENKNKLTEEEFKTSKARLIEWTFPRSFLFRNEILRNVDFISRYKAENLSFIPNSIDIALTDQFFYDNKDIFTEAGLGNQIDNLKQFLFIEGNLSFDKKYRYELFRKKVVVYLFLYSVVRSYYYSGINEALLEFNKEFSKIGNVVNAFDLIYEFLKEYKGWLKYTPLYGVKEIISNFDQFLIVKEDTEFQILNNGFYSFAITENIKQALQKIFDIWTDKNFIFYIRWHGLSAGEAALLNIFSKINYARHSFNDTIWILIDEGDLYLHPEWQRTFLSDLHKYLPLIFREKKIQLILTSHSPFIVSDLPQSNVILLDKDIYGWAKVIDSSSLDKTFGANIHSLLSNAFFLRNGHIGEFSKAIINQLFDHLNSNSFDNEKWNYENCKALINDIGEPLLRQQLTILMDSKYKTKIERDWLDEEIKRLETKKRDLE